MKKKSICKIMILILIITPCHRAYADAGTLTVAGGTIGIGGLSAGALAGLAGPAVVAVFCGMLAVGMDIELTQASQEAGMTKTDFLKSKINQYCQEAGTTANLFYKNIADNMSVTKAGAIELGNQASLQLKQFINWLYNNDMVQEPAEPGTGTGSYVNLNGINCPLLQNGHLTIGKQLNNDNERYIEFSYVPGQIAYCLVKTNSSSTYSMIFISDNPYSFSYQNQTNPIQSVNMKKDTIGTSKLYTGSTVGIAFRPDASLPLYNGTSYDFLSALGGDFTVVNPTGTGVDTLTGKATDWENNKDVFDPSQGFPTTINPGLIGQIPIPADTDITTNVREYLDALQRVLDGIQDRVIQGIDQADGLPYEYDIPDTVAIDPTIGKIPPPQDSERTPVTDDSPPDPATNPSMATDPLKFDLKTIFPFCIPFDIKDMIGLLEADPVAPTYTVNWNIPIVNVPLDFTVDLSPWNSVAIICRRMELLLFIIGLAMVTRNLIRG